MISLDTSVALAYLLVEDHQPPDTLWEETLISRRLLEYEIWTSLHGRGLGGFVGRGMLDAACSGQVFTSPTPDQMLAAAQAVDRGAGTLFIVKNYSGDVMNFEMAAEMYEGTSTTVLTNDDVAVEDNTYTTGRRGVAGTLVVEKWWARQRSPAPIWRHAARWACGSTSGPPRWVSP